MTGLAPARARRELRRTDEGGQNVKLSKTISSLAILVFLGACAREEILTGERLGVREIFAGGQAARQGEPANRAQPIRLPAAVTHAAWTQRAGEPDHSIRHPALAAAPSLLWAARIGAGNDRRGRITADPVAAGGRIFTLDSRAGVSAISAAGATLWQRDLTPASDRPGDASGGGLALAGDTLFVTTGFGTLNALDAASGALKWTQKFDAPVSGAPTVTGGVVYLSSKDNRGFALDAASGRIRWQVAGIPDLSGIVGASSPAVAGNLVLFPFSSGELVAVARNTGRPAWRVLVAGARIGRGYSAITDITGEPVVTGGVVYVGNSVGRTIAIDLTSGRQRWSAGDGATGPVWAEGGSVFLISDEASLVRLDARTGARIWAVDLPYFTKERARRRKAVYANYGPVLAGGQLWVASSDGWMRAFNPEDGALLRAVEIPGGASSRPIVVDNVAYLVSGKGQLLAYR